MHVKLPFYRYRFDMKQRGPNHLSHTNNKRLARLIARSVSLDYGPPNNDKWNLVVQAHEKHLQLSTPLNEDAVIATTPGSQATEVEDVTAPEEPQEHCATNPSTIEIPQGSSTIKLNTTRENYLPDRLLQEGY